jgi:hypothetical protein
MSTGTHHTYNMGINRETGFVLWYFMMQTYFHIHISSIKQDCPTYKNLGDDIEFKQAKAEVKPLTERVRDRNCCQKI